MNKSDIFDEKIKLVPFTKYKEDYPEEQKHDGESVKTWIQNEFSNRFHNPSSHAKKYDQNGLIVYKNNEEEKEDANDNNSNDKANRALHFHMTCASDTNQIETVVRSVQIELIRKLMSKATLR